MPGLTSIWAISVIMFAPGCYGNAGPKSSTIDGGQAVKSGGASIGFGRGTANPDLLGIGEGFFEFRQVMGQYLVLVHEA